MALILIADDSASERHRLRQLMEEDDHIVVEADNKLYCLELIEVHRLDGALFNPFLSRTEEIELELLEALQNRQIPAIAITENQHSQASQKCLEYGVFKVMDKSSSETELQNTLAMALGLKPLPQSPSESQTTQPPSTEQSSNFTEFLSVNSFKNLISLGIETAAETLNELADCPILFKSPLIETLTPKSLKKLHKEYFGSEPISVAQLPFSGGFSGTSQLFFLTDSADALTEAITGEEPGSDDFDQTKAEMLTEIGNIVLNGIMGTMSNAMTKSLEFSVPSYIEETIDNVLRAHSFGEDKTILFAQARFAIEELQVTGDIILFFQVD